VDSEFGPAAIAIYTGDLQALADLLADDPGLATRTSSCSHPTLLQLVACESSGIADPVGAARLLMRAGSATHSPLVAAAGCASRAVLEFMLDHGVGVDGEDELLTPLDEALYWSHRSIAELLVTRRARVRALSTAAGLGDVEAINSFFDGSALRPDAGPIGSPFPGTLAEELSRDRQSLIDHAFVMAVNNGQVAAAARLLEVGAGVNAVPPGYHWRGTALHAAVWRGDRNVVAWLLDRGADPSIRDGLANSDAAGWASHHGHQDLLPLLHPTIASRGVVEVRV
jgi:ankyrin repeat protein